jgi:hypothetical protein
MPGRDGTGPVGAGAMTGRGLGVCAGGAPGCGAGRVMGLGRRGGRGYGREFGGYASPDRDVSMTRKKPYPNRLYSQNDFLRQED